MALPKEIETYSGREVEEALNNATIALLRSEWLKDFKAVRGTTLKAFTGGLVEILTDETLADPVTGKLMIPPAELSLALLAASLLVLYKYELTDDKAQKTFVRQLVKG